jgi:hypothetical protein
MIIIWVIFGALLPIVYKQDKYRHYPKAVNELTLQHNFIVNPIKNTNPIKEKEYVVTADMTFMHKWSVYKRNVIANLRAEHSWFAAFHRHHLTGKQPFMLYQFDLCLTYICVRVCT